MRGFLIETTMSFRHSKDTIFICLLVLILISRATCSFWAINMLSKSQMPLQSSFQENRQEEKGRKCCKGSALSEFFNLQYRARI